MGFADKIFKDHAACKQGRSTSAGDAGSVRC